MTNFTPTVVFRADGTLTVNSQEQYDAALEAGYFAEPHEAGITDMETLGALPQGTSPAVDYLAEAQKAEEKAAEDERFQQELEKTNLNASIAALEKKNAAQEKTIAAMNENMAKILAKLEEKEAAEEKAAEEKTSGTAKGGSGKAAK